MSRYPGRPESDLKRGLKIAFYTVIALAHRSENMDKDVYLVTTNCCGQETTRARNSLHQAKITNAETCYQCRGNGKAKSLKYAEAQARLVLKENKAKDSLALQAKFAHLHWGIATKLQTCPVTLY